MNNARNAPCADLRLRRGAEHLTDLGARSTAEFLLALARAHDIEADLLARLDLWRDVLTREMIVAAGADRFPPLLRAVPA